MQQLLSLRHHHHLTVPHRVLERVTDHLTTLHLHTAHHHINLLHPLGLLPTPLLLMQVLLGPEVTLQQSLPRLPITILTQDRRTEDLLPP